MKLKPLSKDEDLAAIPVDEPVLVELEPQIVSAQVEDDVVIEPERQPDDAAPGAKDLQAQLEALQQASAAELERERKEKQDALKAAQDARRENESLRAQTLDTEGDLIANSLSSAQAESAAAKAAFKVAYEAGDAEKQAEAQERISRAAVQIWQAERDAAHHAERKEHDTRTPEPAQPVSIEAAIDADPRLMAAEKTWLKAHHDAWADPQRNQELGVAYNRAVKAGKVRGTPDYFKFIDEFMGYAQAAEPTDTERTPPMTAPVSRDSRSSINGRPSNPTRVQLSPDERQMARNMGLSDAAYARGKIAMASDKSSNPEKYAAR